MKGYPKYIATKQDYENLLSMPEFSEQAAADLDALSNMDTETVTRAVRLIDPDNPNGGWVTEEIDNPAPVWQRKGFETIETVQNAVMVANNTLKEVRNTQDSIQT